MKVGVFRNDTGVIVVGLDDNDQPIGSNGFLYGTMHGRNLSGFKKFVVDVGNGESIRVDYSIDHSTHVNKRHIGEM